MGFAEPPFRNGAGALLPHRFIHHLSAGLFSVALVVTRIYQVPGRYPARCPLVFGLSSYKFLQAIARLASLLQGFNILAKNVQQLQFRFIVFICMTNFSLSTTFTSSMNIGKL